MANAVVSQSGGPTGVINASLVGVIEEASKHKEIDKLYGAVHAVSGIVKEHFIDLKKLSLDTLERVAASPSSALGSSRDKPDAEYCRKILNVFKKHDIRYFYYIGGNDSANTCYIINNMAEQEGYQLRAFHVPKTVDNDLRVTDHCPGYGTAARFVACALMGDDLDNRALPGIKIDVVMGRHAGFLTGAAVLGKQREDDGPHLVYIPERPVTMDKFLADVDAVYKKLGRCVVAVSEGMCGPDGKTYAEMLAENAERDAHGNVQLSGTGALADYLAGQVKGKLGVKRVRADTFGYLQRSFAGLQSPTDVDEARRCGRQAVLYSMKEDNGSVAMKRLGNGPKYAVELFRTNLSEVAEHTKSVPDEFINAEGNGMTKAFVEYAAPLVGELPKTEYLGTYPKVKV
ncbi:MAG TPA: 6-phosphofructokinase [Anaerohalosphaeraceae bacterium]|jgi:6-phosphofructokinase|nr:6-phosphofructokinase [Anaerohalosphaeraceae bacterium]HRT51202.1 6-phosphofructokinase [Anaerohalosphaeraceae bacterium]HRT87464.1 6-phosphofructokinase [Anaerohalosphaeraceae bacterium]